MKPMKLKTIAAAIATLSAFGASAAVLDSSANPTVVFVSGASAQAQAFNSTAANVCDVPADARWYTSAKGDVGMLCDATANGYSALLVIQRSANGSAAGINQVLSNAAIPTETEAETMKMPCTVSGAGTAGGATSAALTNLSTFNAACVTTAGVNTYKSGIALSDVQPTEFATGVVNEGAGRVIGDLVVGVTALQGFGIIAGLSGTYTAGAGAKDVGGKFDSTDNMYRKLQEQNVAEGKLAAACTASAVNTDVSADCQPSIKRTEYASLASVEGLIKTPAKLLPNVVGIPAAAKVVVHRRVSSSGTQAASNIFFLDTVCRDDASRGGNLTPSATTSAPKYKVVENSQTSDVRNGVAAAVANEWTIGVISLDNPTTHASSTKRRWVKIDGVSPDFNPDLTADTTQRNAIKNGSYPFAFEMTAMYNDEVDSTLADTIIGGLKDSNNDLRGIAFLDNVVAARQARFTRDGNNCQGLK